MKQKTDWEGMGAASGVLAALALIAGFIVFLTTSPTGTPGLPAVENAQQAPAYLAGHLSAYRFELLFTSLGLMLFLWFLGSLWTTLKTAEGDPGRGSVLTVVGAVVSTVLMQAGIILGFTSALSTSPAQAQNVPMLYTAGALMFAFGGGALALFFFGVARVVFRTHVLHTWFGVLAVIAAIVCLPAFLTPFFDSGPLDAATGVLGHWLWYVAFMLWLIMTGTVLTLRQRAAARQTPDTTPSTPTGPATEAAETKPPVVGATS